LRIISWNVNGVRAVHKKGFMEFWANLKPDILCLQETKCQKDQLTPDILNPFDYQSHWSCALRKGYSGVATFHKDEIQSMTPGIGVEKFDSEGRIVITKHEKFTLYNIYFPNGASGKDRHEYKMEFLRTLNAHLKPLVDRGEPIIVVGDYNVAPTDIDVYDPIKLARASGFLPEEKEWFQSFLNLGFIDTFRHFHPDEKQRFSWWNQMERGRLGNRGWRIDIISVTKNLLPYIKSADIADEIEGSDHCPVILDVSF
jgi:exodeoxyribonuclease-3